MSNILYIELTQPSNINKKSIIGAFGSSGAIKLKQEALQCNFRELS